MPKYLTADVPAGEDRGENRGAPRGVSRSSSDQPLYFTRPNLLSSSIAAIWACREARERKGVHGAAMKPLPNRSDALTQARAAFLVASFVPVLTVGAITVDVGQA